jgi:hypothetical protein
VIRFVPQPNLDAVLSLLATLGAEVLNHGVFREKTLAVFRAVYASAGVMDTMLARLSAGSISDPAAVAWFLVKLAQVRGVVVRHLRSPDFSRVKSHSYYTTFT